MGNSQQTPPAIELETVKEIVGGSERQMVWIFGFMNKPGHPFVIQRYILRSQLQFINLYKDIEAFEKKSSHLVLKFNNELIKKILKIEPSFPQETFVFRDNNDLIPMDWFKEFVQEKHIKGDSASRQYVGLVEKFVDICDKNYLDQCYYDYWRNKNKM